MKIIFALAISFILSVGVCNAQQETNAPRMAAELSLESVLEKYRSKGIEKWEEDIQKLEKRNAEEAMPDDSCGYGGAKYVDMVLFADRILSTKNYRSLVMFAANDVSGKDKPNSTPEEVSVAILEIIRISKSHHPDAPIFIIEITPTLAREQVWDKTRQINAALREVALSTPNTWFITTAERYLNPDGSIKGQYFVEDKLHLNADGYKVWARRCPCRQRSRVGL